MTDPAPPSLIIMNAPGTESGPVPRLCDGCGARHGIHLSTAQTIFDLGPSVPPVMCYDCAMIVLGATRANLRLVGNSGFRQAMNLDPAGETPHG